jgi:FG-GAP repeat protein
MRGQSLISVLALWFLGITVTLLVIISSRPEVTDPGNEVRHETQRISATDATMDAHFGASVALNGDMALIGAPLDDMRHSAPGAAYLFAHRTQGNWSPFSKLSASAPSPHGSFGQCVALDGTTALVGARGDRQRGEDAGAAYAFEVIGNGSSLTQVARLTASDAVSRDHFGHSLALDGNLAVVGSPGKRDGAGAAYLFQRDSKGNWNEIATLTADDPEIDKRFGWSVAISGQAVLIGAYGDSSAGMQTGAVYVFRCEPAGHWKQAAKLMANDAAAYSEFGWSVALEGGTAVIGARTDKGVQSHTGAAYVFGCDASGSWHQVAKLNATDAAKLVGRTQRFTSRRWVSASKPMLWRSVSFQSGPHGTLAANRKIYGQRSLRR